MDISYQSVLSPREAEGKNIVFKKDNKFFLLFFLENPSARDAGSGLNISTTSRTMGDLTSVNY
jgi:hypothetical protein